MEDLPYYLTWTKQKNASTFDVIGGDEFHWETADHGHIIDLSSISYQASFGLKPAFIIDRIKSQLDIMPIASSKARFHLKHENSERLLKLLGLHGGKMFFTVSGSEAIENALKMARQFNEKKIILSRKKSYHGASLGAVSISGDWRNEIPYKLEDGTVRIPEPEDDPDLSKTRAVIESLGANKICAICLETVTGSNGIIQPKNEWWQGIQALCDEFGILLILDEVVCGFGRIGKHFGFQSIPGIHPDFVCMAKAITGGMVPFGAVWTNSKIAAFYDNHLLNCGLTNYGHPVGLAAMTAVLDKIEDPSFYAHFSILENSLKNFLSTIKKHPRVTAVRQIGMLAAIDLDNMALPLKDLIAHNVYLINQTNRLILAPALTMPKELLENGLARVGDMIAEKAK
jgi:taurine--2-oxoglutarate transaminase